MSTTLWIATCESLVWRLSHERRFEWGQSLHDFASFFFVDGYRCAAPCKWEKSHMHGTSHRSIHHSINHSTHLLSKSVLYIDECGLQREAMSVWSFMSASENMMCDWLIVWGDPPLYATNAILDEQSCEDISKSSDLMAWSINFHQWRVGK